MMSTAIGFQLSQSEHEAAAVAAGKARTFLEGASFPLGVAMVDHVWSEGSEDAVIAELAKYQNEDGGFGKGLEVDIKAPASNPFAARLAMRVLLGIAHRPASDLETRLKAWLVANQHDDGDWHLSDETKAGELAPWFAGWTSPSLNPACCIAGLANRLGIATPGMLERVARLFSEKASPDDLRQGEFYNVLPYVEYAGGVEWEQRATWLDMIATTIVQSVEQGKYADAPHFWEHVFGGGPDLVRRLSADMLARYATGLIEEQERDGGWPTPYDSAWRPLLTAEACVTLARLLDGI
jgi:hypothetical protein